jgi:hypothetical protein
MKSIKLLFAIIFLLVSSAFAQNMQYVSGQSGDTLVVKDDVEFSSVNTLYLLMASDSMAPATRVYELQNGGIYSLVNNPVTSSEYRTVIMGQSGESVKTRQGAAPPIICGAIETGVAVFGGMIVNKDLLIKNINLEIGNRSGNSGGWAFFSFTGPGQRLQVDNCIMEHTWWVWVGGPPADTRIFFTNDYFINLNGFYCRRNGGVTDFNAIGVTRQDTLMVENCTHVNTQGSLYRFRSGVAVIKVIFNHNDFIDCAGYVMMNNGDQTNMSVTNNIFVNCQLQAYSSVLFTADAGEVDPDGLPMGLINLRVDSTFRANGANFYADKNLAYWDPSLSDIVSTLNSNSINGSTEWVSQMILMNARSENLFSDNAKYPLLTNGAWITDKLPAFVNTDVLFTTQLAALKAYALAAVDTGYETPMSSWRQPGNEEAVHFIFADWPIPIDLSYTDSELLTAGLGGFPLGDLNWFPTEYAQWKAQASAEYAAIQCGLSSCLGAVETATNLPQKFQLQQNYPNPFNPTTVINFTIPKAGYVSLKVYNMLGQEVATLVDGYKAAQTYNINFDASNLSSGVYLYSVKFNNQVLSKKMILMK